MIVSEPVFMGLGLKKQSASPGFKSVNYIVDQTQSGRFGAEIDLWTDLDTVVLCRNL